VRASAGSGASASAGSESDDTLWFDAPHGPQYSDAELQSEIEARDASVIELTAALVAERASGEAPFSGGIADTQAQLPGGGLVPASAADIQLAVAGDQAARVLVRTDALARSACDVRAWMVGRWMVAECPPSGRQAAVLGHAAGVLEAAALQAPRGSWRELRKVLACVDAVWGAADPGFGGFGRCAETDVAKLATALAAAAGLAAEGGPASAAATVSQLLACLKHCGDVHSQGKPEAGGDCAGQLAPVIQLECSEEDERGGALDPRSGVESNGGGWAPPGGLHDRLHDDAALRHARAAARAAAEVATAPARRLSTGGRRSAAGLDSSGIGAKPAYPTQGISVGLAEAVCRALRG
jgi:hypothetical protein